MQLRRALVASLIPTLLALSGAFRGPAHADKRQPDGPPDKEKHTWCYGGGFTMTATADAAMTWLRTQTAVQTAYHSTCTAHTDVRWSQGSVTATYGRAACRVRNSNNYCDLYRIKLNKSIINAASHPASLRRKTTCHELGHTVGVRHYAGSDLPGKDTAHSCMRSGAVPAPDKAWHTRYGAHHRTHPRHINAWFN